MQIRAIAIFSFTAVALLAHVETHAGQMSDSGFMSPNIVSADRKVVVRAAPAPAPQPTVRASTPSAPSTTVSPEKAEQHEAAKPSYPRCSSRLSDVKAMMQDVLHMDMLDKLWTEDEPRFGGKSRIKVYGTDPLIVEMFDGSGDSVGTTKVTACVTDGKLTAHIKMAGLNFGLLATPTLKTQLAIAQNGNTSELIMDISRASSGKVRIADRMTMFKQRIDSTFSASAAR